MTIHILFSQKIYEFNIPSAKCYSQYIFQENSASPKGVLVIDARGEDLITLSQNNIYVKSGLFTDYNIVYINILDKEINSSLNCYNAIIYTIASVRKIKESVFFLINTLDENKQKAIIYKDSAYPFNFINNNHGSLEVLKAQLDTELNDKSYTTDKLYSYEDIQLDKMKNYKDNFDVGFFYSPFALFGPKLNSTSDVVVTKGLSFKKALTSQSTLLLNVSIGNKKPEGGIEPGKKGTVRVFMLMGTELMYRYYDSADKPLRFFSSLGIGGYTMTNMKIKIKKGGVSTSSDSNQYFTFLADAGLEYRISPMFKISSSLPIKYFSNNINKNYNTLGVGINLGILATLNSSSKSKAEEKRKTEIN
ncbi:hypothetical protein [Flavobacterium polysaccharolyticum]|uniref:Outer membrane protein beta-barrel domain-containing protein n=1 Tax=Flavobacterium polysaccharolyticum TaxID=3133148 RepID=A0ABU9NRV5_9FLAO